MAKTYGLMRDVMDGQLVSADGIAIGRVADVDAEWSESGELILRHVVCGPEALLRRLSSRLGGVAAKLFRGRFDHRIPIDDIEELSDLQIVLKKPASEYAVGASERWIRRRIFRFIPGSGA
jgi:hypothetical protein